jgi:la-related protein 1
MNLVIRRQLILLTPYREYYFSLENLLKDMYLRKQMDSKGFVFFSVIAGFNRIKQLTTDPDLIKLVCYQSRNIEFRIGNDGKERLRLREGWEQWVLPMVQRDSLAQNEGPEEVYNPPIPHPPGFDQGALPRYPEMPAASPTAPAPFGNQALYPAVNGFHPGAPQHVTNQPNEKITNGEVADKVNGTGLLNGHPIDASTKAVSGEPDSFSDEQVESLTVVVRKHDQSQLPNLPPSVTRTFSNGSLDSRSGVPDEHEKADGTGFSRG